MEVRDHDPCCKQGCNCIWRRRKHGDKIAPSDFNHEAGRHPYGSPMPLEDGQPDKNKNGMLPGTQEMYTAPDDQELPATSEPRP